MKIFGYVIEKASINDIIMDMLKDQKKKNLGLHLEIGRINKKMLKKDIRLLALEDDITIDEKNKIVSCECDKDYHDIYNKITAIFDSPYMMSSPFPFGSYAQNGTITVYITHGWTVLIEDEEYREDDKFFTYRSPN